MRGCVIDLKFKKVMGRTYGIAAGTKAAVVCYCSEFMEHSLNGLFHIKYDTIIFNKIQWLTGISGFHYTK